MLLARYTPSYDLRDRARVYRALLALPTSTELASLLLLAPKPVPQAPSPSESHKGYSLGSASLVVGNAAGVNGLRGYEAIPDWVAEGDEPNAKLRDAGGVEKDLYQPQKAVSAGQMLDDALEADPGFKSNGRKAKTLDDWLDDEDESESESESGSGSEESEEESEYETDEDAESGEEESDSEDDEKAGLVK
jgi:AP-3 complex subunit beta